MATDVATSDGLTLDSYACAAMKLVVNEANCCVRESPKPWRSGSREQGDQVPHRPD